MSYITEKEVTPKPISFTERMIDANTQLMTESTASTANILPSDTIREVKDGGRRGIWRSIWMWMIRKR